MSYRGTLLGIAMTIAVTGTALGQIAPLKPEGWTDLQAWSHGLGLIVNGERMCGISYNQARIDEHYALTASVSGVSVRTLRQAALQQADIQAPHVTRDTCSTARKIANRNGWLN